MTQLCERSPFWVSPYAPEIASEMDVAPRPNGRIEGYFGVLVVRPLASCPQCGQVVMYETGTGALVEATICRCVEQ